MGESREALTPKEAAVYLGKHQWTLRDWRRREVGPPYIREVGRIIYLKSDIDQWRDKNRWA